MNKYNQQQAVHDAIEEGIHTSNPQEELIWREVAAVYHDELKVKAAIKAMDTIIRTARLARTKLRRVV